jgi:N-acetylneuraminic acid mutarotase
LNRFVVTFDTAKAVVKTANDSILTVVVPDDLQKSNSAITVSLSGNTSSLNGFELNTPIVSLINPLTGKFQDEITISGSGFNVKHSRVFFDSKEATVTLRRIDLIRCKVPSGLPPGTVKLKVNPGVESLSVLTDFHSQSPNIIAITPMQGTFGDEITIAGEFFGANGYENSVRFGETEAEITYASASEIRVIVPHYLLTPEHDIKVTYNQGVDVSDDRFTLLAPTIVSISPERISSNELITITGTNFNPWYPEFNRILFGSEEGGVIQSVSESEIQILVPVNIYSHTVNISAIVAGQASNSITAVSPWVRIQDPPQNMIHGVNFVHEDFAYMGLGDGGSYNFTATMWKFNPDNNGWTKLADFPGGARSHSIFFKLGDKGYVGGGEGQEGPFNDFWEYDFSTDQWVQKNNLPFDLDNSYGAAAFSDNNSSTILIRSNDVWIYEPVTDAWVTTTTIPGAGLYLPSGFSKNGEIYVFGGGYYTPEMYKYTPATEEWTLVGGVPGELTNGGFIFDIDGQIYIGDAGSQGYKNFWRYDPMSHEFTSLEFYAGEQQFGRLGVSVNGKGYLFSGYHFSDCWKYDPDI